MAAGRVRTSPLESLMPLKLKVSEDGGMLQIVLYIEAIYTGETVLYSERIKE